MRTAFYADVKTNPAFQGQEILVGTNIGWSSTLRPGLRPGYSPAPAYPSARARAREARRASIFGWVLPLLLLGGLGWLGYFGSERAVQAARMSWQGSTPSEAASGGADAHRVYQVEDGDVPGPFSKASAMWNDLRTHLHLGKKAGAAANQ